jgi:hypothetical protein
VRLEYLSDTLITSTDVNSAQRQCKEMDRLKTGDGEIVASVVFICFIFRTVRVGYLEEVWRSCLQRRQVRNIWLQTTQDSHVAIPCCRGIGDSVYIT